MASDEVNRLRAEYKKMRRNVGNKISRIKRVSGAKIAGTEFDPRKPLGHEKRLNATQLRAAINKLSSFQARSNQFAAGIAGTPFPRKSANTYEAKVALRKQRAEQFKTGMDKVAQDLIDKGQFFVESAGNMKGLESTPSQFQAQLHQRAEGGLNNPFNDVGSDIKNITSLGALKRLELMIDKQLSPDFFENELHFHQDQMANAMEKMGEYENAEMVRGLSDFQFAMMWYGTSAAEETFLKYGSSMAIEEGRGKPKDVKIVEQSNISVFLRDAAKLPEDGTIISVK